MESKLVFATTLVLIFCAKSSLAGPHGDHPWCYNTPACDSKTWSGMCHTGKVQSPVDFNTENISENRTQVRLRFNQAYFDVQNRFYAKNNGHTLQVQLEQDLSSKLVMDGDGLKGNYVFSQFHFHWGSTDDKGSEHTVGGKSYPLELHLVHYNDMFKGLGDAVGSKNHRALAVFGIFFKISPNDNWALKPIIEAIAGSQNVQEEASLIHRPLNISSFFPDELDLFRYYGSLTTPSCFEIVHWNVFKKPVPISKAQLQAFRSIKDSHGDNLVDNFRPTLPLAGRRVTEYEVVELDLKPSKTAEDARKPMPDADYEEVMNVLDPKTTSSHGKKSSAAAPRTNFLLLGLLSGVVLFFPKLNNVTSASEVYGPMMQRISMFVLLFIGAFLSPVQSGDSGAGGRQVASSSSAVDFLDRGPAGPSGREEDAGLYGPAPPLPLIAGTRGGNGATTLADHLKGANYPPESAIDQFEVGYGGTYYRKDGDRSGPERNVRPNNNHIGYGPSGSSFDKPLDSFRETGSNPLNLNGLSVAELEQLRNLAEAAQGIGNAARQGGGGGGNGGVGSLNAGNGNAGGPNVVANHGTLGPLLPKDSQDDKGLTYGSGGGASSSYKPLLEYGPGGGPGVLQGVLDAQIKLNALRSQLLAHNLAKLDHHAAKVHAGAYGPPPGHHYGPGPLDHHHHKSALLNLHPLFGKLDAVDAHLLGKLQAKDIELANLEREKLQLIAAAGKAALGSIREKEKLVHLYGQLGIADALNNPLGKHHPPGPGFGYHPAAGAEKAAALADKAALLADKAAAHADKAADIANHHANHAAGHEYNPNFGPLPADKIHLNPIKPLGYGAPLAPPLGNYGGAFGGGLLSPAAREVLTIHPIYNSPLAVKQVHNVIVKEQLKGQHYYGPAPGPNYAAYNGHAVGKGALFGEHGLAPHQRPGPYPSVDDVVHRHNGGYGVPPAAHLHGKLDVLVENVAKNTAKALVGALQGYGYGNKHNHYNNHH